MIDRKFHCAECARGLLPQEGFVFVEKKHGKEIWRKGKTLYSLKLSNNLAIDGLLSANLRD